MKYYTGIGSRSTPPDVLKVMTQVAKALADHGFTLRSGHAEGADKAFEAGAGHLKEIYLPWPGFNGSGSSYSTITDAALEMARQYHPAFNVLSQAAQKLMARNCYQVLGYDLQTPSKFVICWTPDGCASKGERSAKTGGTGQAIALASDHGIPVFNLQRAQDMARVKKYIEWRDDICV